MFITNNFGKVDAVKRKIVQLYAEDFLKIDTSGKATQLFMSIPSALTDTPPRLISEMWTKKLVNLLKALEDSKCVNMTHHAC